MRARVPAHRDCPCRSRKPFGPLGPTRVAPVHSTTRGAVKKTLAPESRWYSRSRRPAQEIHQRPRASDSSSCSPANEWRRSSSRLGPFRRGLRGSTCVDVWSRRPPARPVGPCGACGFARLSVTCRDTCLSLAVMAFELVAEAADPRFRALDCIEPVNRVSLERQARAAQRVRFHRSAEIRGPRVTLDRGTAYCDAAAEATSPSFLRADPAAFPLR